MALYSTSWKVESIEIRWCTCEIDSYKAVILTPYPMTKLFEFQEGYIISTMVSMDMCKILRVLREQDNTVFSNRK